MSSKKKQNKKSNSNNGNSNSNGISVSIITPSSVSTGRADLKAMYDKLIEFPAAVDESIFSVSDDDIIRYNEQHDDDLNALLQHVDTLFDTDSNDRNNNIKEFLDTLMDKIKLADENETKYMNTYKTLLIEKNKSMSRKLGLEDSIDKTSALIQSKQDECREIRSNSKKNIEDKETERDNERMKMEDIRVKYFNQILELQNGLEKEENDLQAKISDNENLKSKYKDFDDSIKQQQESFANQIRHRELEIQLLRARIQQEEQLLEQNKRRQEAYDSSIMQHMKNENERLEKIELYKTYLSSSSSSPEQGINNIQMQFEQRRVEIREAIKNLEIVNKHLRDQHNAAKTQLMTVTNEREQLLDTFKTLKENCDDVEKRCRELKEKRTKPSKTNTDNDNV